MKKLVETFKWILTKYAMQVKVKLPVHLNGMELMHIKHSTVTKVKKLVETFEWILTKYVMESLNESGQAI